MMLGPEQIEIKVHKEINSNLDHVVLVGSLNLSQIIMDAPKWIIKHQQTL